MNKLQLRSRDILWLLLVVSSGLLTACSPLSSITPPSATVSPTRRPRLTPTPLPRWEEYENAISNVFFPNQFNFKKGFCEWTILGQGNNEVYVWAICKTRDSYGSRMSSSAVIRLSDEGKIIGAAAPGAGSSYSEDVKLLFPPEIQKIISEHRFQFPNWDHIDQRLNTPGPPLIVVMQTPLP